MAATTTVEFWFDPACPWAWMTSRWMDEVARQRPEVSVTWKPMSLWLLNSAQHEDPDYLAGHGAAHQRTFALGKLLAGIAEEAGNDQVKALYDELGERIHHQRRTDDALVDESIQAAGIEQELVARAGAGEFDALLQGFQQEALDRVGQDVGTPVISVNGVAFFGPVISPAPKGEAALRLFDGIVMAAEYDGFFELKRSRTRGPEFN